MTVHSVTVTVREEDGTVSTAIVSAFGHETSGLSVDARRVVDAITTTIKE